MTKRIGRLYNLFFKIFSRVGKRKRFILSTIVLSFLVLLSTFFSFPEILFFLPIILVAVYFFTFFSILEGLSRHEWIMLFVAPLYFTLVVTLFYFFLPQRWLTRLPFVLIYSVCIYAIMLSQNIFNVGVFRSLQLFRAAFSVNYLFATISSFLAFSLIASLRSSFVVTGPLVFIASFPVVFHFLWAVNPQEEVDKKLVLYTLFISLLLGETAVFVSFMPLEQSVFALLLTALFYSLCGLFQSYLQQTLFRERIREYILVLLFVSAIAYLSLGW